MAPVRLAWMLAGVAVLAGGVGCKSDEGGGKAVSADVTGRMQKLQAEEGDVLSRRADLARERKKVQADRAALAEKRKQVLEAGGDVKAVDQEEQELLTRETELDKQEQQLNGKIETLLANYQEMSLAASGGDAMARRETSVAVREKDLARREEALGRREAELAARERGQAQREKETCGTGTVTTIVQAAPLPKGAKYNKRDVEPVLRKARKKMSEKGLLHSDLPAPAQALEKEATSAMADGDFGKAKFAADQLYATVESMRVDKSFVVGKINRLNALVKSKQLAEDNRKEVDDLFRGATGDYGDGKFTAANSKLNKIYALIR
jgi:hypothetical protein